jgi:nucleotide-binding universal stress UspA family protein
MPISAYINRYWDSAFAELEGDDPAAVLREHCREHGFDLIVVGHHHAGRAGRLLLQGTAPRMIEAAERAGARR